MTVRIAPAARRGVLWVGLLGLALAGCAGGKPPCTIIPAQLDLARMQRDRAKVAYDGKKDDVERQKSSNQVSEERLASLLKERDELKAELAAAGADTTRNKAGDR